MTDKSLEMLKWLLEDLETDEGVCYKNPQQHLRHGLPAVVRRCLW